MSTIQYQSISGDGPIDHHELEEEYFKSFDTAYNGDWLANLQSMQPNGQNHPMSTDYSLDNPSNMEPAVHFTEPLVDLDLNFSTQTQSDWQNLEAFGEQSMHIPTQMHPAKQPILDFGYQNSNASTNMQYIEQPTASLTNQSSYDPTNTSPLKQHNQAPINHSGNTAGNVLPHGQASQPTIHYGSNLHTNTTSDEQTITAPVQSSSNPQTNIPLDEEATPAPVPFSGKGKKKPRTTKKHSSVTTPRKAKHPAVVEDKEIERWAREYDIPYDETRILLDYANARVKGIETSEPEDAPSRYIMSRFEQVRRTHPDHATWPYDLPEEKIIRLLPGQQKQCRAPHQSQQDACEKRRQELDDRYKESRHWEGPPPPKPGQTDQNTSTDPATNTIATRFAAPSNFESAEAAIDNNATGLGPPPADWSLDSAEVRTNNVRTGLKPPPDFESAEIANDIIAFGSAAEQDDTKTSTNVNSPAVFDQSQLDYLFEEPVEPIDNHEMVQQSEQPAQLPSPPLPTSASTKQDNPDPAASPNSAGVFDQSQLDYLFEELNQDNDVTEMDQQPEEPAQHPSLPALPTWTPMEHDNADPFANVDVPVVPNDSLYGSMLDEESEYMSGTDFNSLMQFLQEGSEENGGQDLEMEM